MSKPIDLAEQADHRVGYKAQEAGKAFVHNPFRSTVRRRAWINGWLDSFQRAPWQATMEPAEKAG
jgi:ribosome modulation factor